MASAVDLEVMGCGLPFSPPPQGPPRTTTGFERIANPFARVSRIVSNPSREAHVSTTSRCMRGLHRGG